MEKKKINIRPRNLKEFVFRFDIYDGSEPAKQVYDGEVVQYTFVNQGKTIVIINGGMILYPAYTGILPNQIEMPIRSGEMDVTIYNYEFKVPDYAIHYKDVAGITTPFIIPFSDVLPDLIVNRLLVISKVKATVETSNP